MLITFLFLELSVKNQLSIDTIDNTPLLTMLCADEINFD